MTVVWVDTFVHSTVDQANIIYSISDIYSVFLPGQRYTLLTDILIISGDDQFLWSQQSITEKLLSWILSVMAMGMGDHSWGRHQDLTRLRLIELFPRYLFQKFFLKNVKDITHCHGLLHELQGAIHSRARESISDINSTTATHRKTEQEDMQLFCFQWLTFV